MIQPRYFTTLFDIFSTIFVKILSNLIPFYSSRIYSILYLCFKPEKVWSEKINMTLSIVNFKSFEISIAEALDEINARAEIEKQHKILLKPNIVTKDYHPITTHPKMCEAVIKYIRNFSNAEIIIGDGCGLPSYTTLEAFQRLGYSYLEKEYNIKLIDLNTAESKLFKNPNCSIHKELYLPELITTHYIISLPVLKAHSLSKVTGSMKNMMGLLPPRHYSGRFGSWNKAVFHNKIQQSIMDLNMYVTPPLTVLDASIGMAQYHLGGATCNPPVNKILAGYNAREIDRKAAELLGFNPNKIGHLK